MADTDVISSSAPGARGWRYTPYCDLCIAICNISGNTVSLRSYSLCIQRFVCLFVPECYLGCVRCNAGLECLACVDGYFLENGVCNSKYISVCMSVCPSVRLTVCPCVRVSVCPSVRLSVCPSVRVCLCLSVELGKWFLYSF